MVALYTYRPKTGIGKNLPEAELEEFNCITYEKIINMIDMNKLLRLEQYMREEEFMQTSLLARKRIVELGGKDLCPNAVDPQFCDLDAEYDEFLKNFDIWQDSMKEADNNLLEIHEIKQEKEPSMNVEYLSEQCRKRPLAIDDSMNKKKSKNNINKIKEKKDIRSGRLYYEQWDKYAASAEKAIENEEIINEESHHETKFVVEDSVCKQIPKKETLQQRLLKIGKSKSMTEREWFAKREREKGNDLYKAKEYSASVDIYTMAIELFPKSPLGYGNRAASNIKLKKWEEVVKDCNVAIELDRNYMKAYMRRGLANLEMENPKEAMIDLQKTLEMDPKNQETQTIIRRAEFTLKKLEEKRIKEIEFERRKEGEIRIQKEKEELSMFQNITTSSITSTTSIRMVIEEVDDPIIEENCTSNDNVETNKLQKKNSIEEETKETNKNCNWPSQSKHISTSQEYKPTIENDIVNNNSKMTCDDILAFKNENKKSKKNLSWLSRPHKYNIQSKTNEFVTESLANENDANNIVCNAKQKHKILTNENKTFDTLFNHETQDLSENANEELIMYSDLSNVGLPPEIIEAMKTQQEIPTDHVAFGQAPKKYQQSPICNSNRKVEINSNLKASNNMLAEEWRLSGNSFFSQQKFHKAAECYATSLNYCESAVTYSNRAMTRIKLKNFRGAEEDASHAILINNNFHKAYYRRGLARRALGNLQGAKVDFEEVLRFNPNDKQVIEQLASMDCEYIPMRSGPMIIEEIESEGKESSVEINKKTSHIVQNLEDNILNLDHDKINAVSQVYNINDKKNLNQINLVGSKCISHVETNINIDNHQRSNISSHDSNKTCKNNTRTSVVQHHHTTNTKLLLGTNNVYINESNNLKLVDDTKVEDELERQAKLEKEKGNTCFKNCQYTLAIECYNQSLKCIPTNATVLSNRALCFIHLYEYKKALLDSTKAIECTPGYIKAFHRRAVAAYKLGDFESALKDYQIVATFFPNDEKLKNDINDLKQEIEQTTKKMATMPTLTKSQPIFTSEPCENDDDLLKPLRTTIYKNLNKSSTIQQENLHPNSNVINICNNSSFNKKLENIKSNGDIETAPLKVQKNIKSGITSLPQKPTTALEFERVCKSLTKNPNMAQEYVKSIKIQNYPNLFKESLSASILQCFIHILRKGFMPNDPMGAVAVLRGLTKVKRFSLTVLLVPSADLQGLDTLFYWLEFSTNANVDDILDLRKSFHVL